MIFKCKINYNRGIKFVRLYLIEKFKLDKEILNLLFYHQNNFKLKLIQQIWKEDHPKEE